MTSTWYIILGALVASVVVTFGLWKTGFLRIFLRWFPGFSQTDQRLFYYMTPRQGDEKAIFKLNKIIEAEVPKWMAKPPFSYVICFLIVCVGLGVIILAVTNLLKVIM